MKANRGTSVGFSKPQYDGEGQIIMSNVCKEHEFTKNRYTYDESGKSTKSYRVCGKCGFAKPIEDNNWEDIWNEFKARPEYINGYIDISSFWQWLKENYNPPPKTKP